MRMNRFQPPGRYRNGHPYPSVNRLPGTLIRIVHGYRIIDGGITSFPSPTPDATWETTRKQTLFPKIPSHHEYIKLCLHSGFHQSTVFQV